MAVEPVTDPNAAPKGAPPAAVILTVPTAPLQAGDQPYTMPLQVTQVQQVGRITVMLTYDPKILTAVSTSEGTFMKQGGVKTTYTQKIDPLVGRVDITIVRDGENGASGTDLLGAVLFKAIGSGTTQIKLTAVAMTAAGKAMPITAAPASVTVK